MSGTQLITQRMVELRFGSKVVRDFFDHDRTGQADPERIEEAIDEASDIIFGLLKKGFPSTEQVVELIANDRAVRGYCCEVFMGVAGRMKPGLLAADGTNPYIKLGESAEKKLREIANGIDRRARGEAAAGTNKRLGGSTNRSPIPSVFQATKGDPTGPGGF